MGTYSSIPSAINLLSIGFPICWVVCISLLSRFACPSLQVWTKKLVLHNQELIMCLLTCIICVSLQSTVLWKLTWKDTRDTNDSSLPALQSSDNDDFNCSEDYNSDLDQGMGTYSKKYQKAQQKPTRITNLKA